MDTSRRGRCDMESPVAIAHHGDARATRRSILKYGTNGSVASALPPRSHDERTHRHLARDAEQRRLTRCGSAAGMLGSTL